MLLGRRVASGTATRVDPGGYRSEPGPQLACLWFRYLSGGTSMFDYDLLETKFARIGARLKVSDGLERRRFVGGAVTLDVQDDRKGEFFVIRLPGSEVDVEVLDVQPPDRHLLLMVREGKEKHKFLCGHDERHWFVAAVPESAPVGTVRAAKEALKPAEVQAVQAREGLRSGARNR